MMIKLNIAERETDRETETDRDSLAHSLTLMWMDGWMTPVWICIFDMGTKTHWLTHENGKAFLWIGQRLLLVQKGWLMFFLPGNCNLRPLHTELSSQDRDPPSLRLLNKRLSQ